MQAQNALWDASQVWGDDLRDLEGQLRELVVRRYTCAQTLNPNGAAISLTRPPWGMPAPLLRPLTALCPGRFQSRPSCVGTGFPA